MSENIKKVNNFALELVAVAESQIGLKEIPIGSNWGTNVKKYLNSVGINEPAYWCMAFAYWCVSQVCKSHTLVNPLLKTASVMTQWEFTKVINKASKPQPGDIFILSLGGHTGHTGIVTKVSETTILTIEGNSNNDGSRNGYEVCRKPKGRLINSIHGFIRPFPNL